MTRTTTTTISNKVLISRERSSSPSSGYKFDRANTYNAYGNGTSQSLTRDDVRKTPSGSRRLPLPYKASGSTALSAYISSVCRFPLAGLWHRATTDGTWGAARATLPSVLPWNESLIAERKVRMLKAIGDQKWSVGESLAEARESVSLIASSTKTLQKALLAAARKDWRRVASILRVRQKKLGKAADNAADGWLSYHFGWAPIVSDIANALVYLSGVDDRDDLTFSAASSADEKTYTSFSYGFYDVAANAGLPFSLMLRGRKELQLSWKARVTYKVRISSLRELQRYGLAGLSTPWAVMPGSFLLDWILPIGDYLAAVDATAGLTFDSGFETRFARARVLDAEATYRLGDTQARMDRFSASVVGDGNSFSMSRSGWKGLQTPFYVKDPLGLWKAVTAISLLQRDAYGIRSSMARKV